jgi:hypothetical protein
MGSMDYRAIDAEALQPSRPERIHETGAGVKSGGRSHMSKRPARGIVCPRCGMASAKIIGRSEALPVLYLRCDDCGRTSVSPE